MREKVCWLLACGKVPPSRMAKLERLLARRVAEIQREEPEMPLYTDFYYHDIFPNWPGGGAMSGSMAYPGELTMKEGDEAVIFCLCDRKGHRERLEALKDTLEKRGCPYTVALM